MCKKFNLNQNYQKSLLVLVVEVMMVPLPLMTVERRRGDGIIKIVNIIVKCLIWETM